MDPTPKAGRPQAQFVATINFVPDTALLRRRIDLSTATVEELSRLPGVGRSRAEKIVATRKRRPFRHPADLVHLRLVPAGRLGDLLDAVRGPASDTPAVTALATDPERVMYHKPFRVLVSFDDSASGVTLVRLQAESISHSLDIAREVTPEETKGQRIEFELPAMEDGPLSVEVTLYDSAGNKAYVARQLYVLHNPPTVNAFPLERSARLSRGAALLKGDGNFHCDTGWTIVNGTSSPTSLNRILNWRVLDQGGGVLHTGTWDYGSNISLPAFAVSTGWWFTFSMPPGSAAFNRLNSKQPIRIEWTFREVGTNAPVVFSLTWRAIVAVNVNIIRVGEESFTDGERTRTFNALRQNASSIYQAQDFDVGTISTFIVPLAQANNHETINSNGEAEDLTGDWSVPNQAIDMFVVRSYVGSTAGLSPVGGPCDKSAKGMNGNVIELQASQQLTGVVMAHEIGHYLGLPHITTTNNLMNASVGTASTGLSTSQGNTMKGFGCFLRFL